MTKVIAGLLFVSLLLVGCSDESPRTELLPGEVRLDSQGPEFVKPLLAGDSLRTADLMGQVTLVNFWATWCGLCIIEIPEFIVLQEEWADRPFQFVGVSMDDMGFEAIETFVSDFHMNYPQIADIGELADAFGGVWALPTTFVVNHEGKVLASYTGPLPLDAIRSEIEALVVLAEESQEG